MANGTNVVINPACPTTGWVYLLTIARLAGFLGFHKWRHSHSLPASKSWALCAAHQGLCVPVGWLHGGWGTSLSLRALRVRTRDSLIRGVSGNAGSLPHSRDPALSETPLAIPLEGTGYLFTWVGTTGTIAQEGIPHLGISLARPSIIRHSYSSGLSSASNSTPINSSHRPASIAIRIRGPLSGVV